MTNSFLKGIKAELKKVVWPTKKQLINNTVMVILLVLALAAIVLTFDMIVEFLDLKFWDLIRNKVA
jgi:preprotein translocase subunit SecE